jgi:uncharacterized membrane protein SpoIIM required for sporulation
VSTAVPALRAPARSDALGVGACTAYQVLVIAVVAAVQAGRAAGGAAAEPVAGGPVGLFLHNVAVYGLWVAGALTLGLVPLALCTVASVLSGLALGTAWALHGASTLAFMGHALLELPAFGIGLWLAVRPVGDLWRARARPDGPEDATAAHLLRSSASLTAAALGLLALAAVWETLVVPTW